MDSGRTPSVLIYTAIAFAVTILFKAGVDAQGGAYATSDLSGYNLSGRGSNFSGLAHAIRRRSGSFLPDCGRVRLHHGSEHHRATRRRKVSLPFLSAR